MSQELEEGKSSYRGRSPLILVVRGEVSRGHSSWGKRADQEKIEIRKGGENTNR